MEQSPMDIYCVIKSFSDIRFNNRSSPAPKKTKDTHLEDYYEVRPIKRNIIKKPRHTPHMRQARLEEFMGVKKKSKRKSNRYSVKKRQK